MAKPKQGDKRPPTACVKFGDHKGCYDSYSAKFGWGTHCMAANKVAAKALNF